MKSAESIWDIQTGECLQILRCDQPYEGMNITNITGLTNAEINILRMLGATIPNRCSPIDKNRGKCDEPFNLKITKIKSLHKPFTAKFITLYSSGVDADKFFLIPKQM